MIEPRTNDFGRLPRALVAWGGTCLLLSGFTQSVGVALGAGVTAWVVALSTAAAIHLGYKWRRVVFVLFFPTAIWMANGSSANGGGDLLLSVALGGVAVYLYGVVRMVAAGRRGRLTTSPDGPGTIGALSSLLAMTVATFLFGWWWTNSSSAFHLLSERDYQGIEVCLLFLSISAALAAFAVGIWWRHKWHRIVGIPVFSTGIALGIHAIYYSTITALAVGDPVNRFAAETQGVSSVVLGRFAFAIIALCVGWLLSRWPEATL